MMLVYNITFLVNKQNTKFYFLSLVGSFPLAVSSVFPTLYAQAHDIQNASRYVLCRKLTGEILMCWEDISF